MPRTNIPPHNLKHGQCYTRLYRVWARMLSRCANPKEANYHGRGIAVCARWRNFKDFFADMAESHRIGLTLERRDNDKGYSPENCYWASRKAQANNRRNNALYTVGGKTQSRALWARDSGVPVEKLRHRLRAKGETMVEALKHFGVRQHFIDARS